jgi:hypothetical protein
MKCKHARRAVVLDHYKELDPAEKARLEAHLLACEACAADREETKSVLDLVSAHGRAEVPAFDAEKAWRAVRKEIGGPAPVRAHSLPAWRRFAPAAAGLAVVLAAGILIGRFAIKNGPASGPAPIVAAGTATPGIAVAPSALPEDSVRPVLASYLDDMRPIILDFANSVSAGAPGRSVEIDERLLRGLLLQNVILRRALNGSDPAATELLDDLDLVLKEIINRKGPGGASPAQVRSLIDDRGILFRMQILKTT